GSQGSTPTAPGEHDPGLRSACHPNRAYSLWGRSRASSRPQWREVEQPKANQVEASWVKTDAFGWGASREPALTSPVWAAPVNYYKEPRTILAFGDFCLG